MIPFLLGWETMNIFFLTQPERIDSRREGEWMHTWNQVCKLPGNWANWIGK